MTLIDKFKNKERMLYSISMKVLYGIFSVAMFYLGAQAYHDCVVHDIENGESVTFHGKDNDYHFRIPSE